MRRRKLHAKFREMRRSWNLNTFAIYRAVCGRRTGMCGYTSVPFTNVLVNFFAACTAEVTHITFQWSGQPPQSTYCPFPLGTWTPSNTWFLGPIRVSHPNGISIGSAVFYRAHERSQQADRHKHTDRPRYPVQIQIQSNLFVYTMAVRRLDYTITHSFSLKV